MRKVAFDVSRLIAIFLVLSCASAHPRSVAYASSLTCPTKDGPTSASVTCRTGFVPDCGCDADGQAQCHCVAAAK
jgi:hypothetical protein